MYVPAPRRQGQVSGREIIALWVSLPAVVPTPTLSASGIAGHGNFRPHDYHSGNRRHGMPRGRSYLSGSGPVQVPPVPHREGPLGEFVEELYEFRFGIVLDAQNFDELVGNRFERGIGKAVGPSHR
jgi:hypothetical protein